MAKYTIELRKIQAEFYAAMQDYPIFDESYREGLNDRIYHACKNREIGYETIELFIEQLKEWMDLYMPEFNRQYIANSIELTPLQRAHIIETFSQNTHKKDMNVNTHNDSRKTSIDDSTKTDDNTSVTGARENESEMSEGVENQQNSTDLSTSKSENKNQQFGYAKDFPQDELTDPFDSKYFTNGTVGKAEAEAEGTATDSNTTNANQNTERQSKDTSKSSDISVSHGNRDRDYDEESTKLGGATDEFTHDGNNFYVRERTGNPSYSDFELLEQYRKSFVNVDNMIIRGLKKELFMNIW